MAAVLLRRNWIKLTGAAALVADQDQFLFIPSRQEVVTQSV
jgi:hypothetical protein